jgi:hypothetical protein
MLTTPPWRDTRFSFFICHPLPWDRCYDFLNIFAETFGEKIGVFCLKQS